MNLCYFKLVLRYLWVLGIFNAWESHVLFHEAWDAKSKRILHFNLRFCMFKLKFPIDYNGNDLGISSLVCISVAYDILMQGSLPSNNFPCIFYGHAPNWSIGVTRKAGWSGLTLSVYWRTKCLINRSLEILFYIFGPKIIIIGPTEKYDLPMVRSCRIWFRNQIYDNLRIFIRKLIKILPVGPNVQCGTGQFDDHWVLLAH